MAVVNLATDAERPEPVIPSVEGISLNSAQVRRLRFYYGHGRGKHRAQLDNLDLDLLRVGAINYDPGRMSDYMCVTRLGMQLLAEELERVRKAREPHNTLAGRLAKHLQTTGRLTWENIEFKAAPGVLVRPDVYSLVATHTEKRLCPIVHEVKVSRADFLADVANQAKREGYFKIACYVVYAAPQGMIELSEVPDDCGLIVELKDGVWKQLRRGQRRSAVLTSWHYMNLVLKSLPEVGIDV